MIVDPPSLALMTLEESFKVGATTSPEKVPPLAALTKSVGSVWSPGLFPEIAASDSAELNYATVNDHKDAA